VLKLNIIEIDNYDYKLRDKSNKEYTINIEFIDLDTKPVIGDYLYLPNKIVKEKNIYTFGPIGNKYSRKENIEGEVIKVVTGIKEYYLQRCYG
jgi:hypothetical protein